MADYGLENGVTVLMLDCEGAEAIVMRHSPLAKIGMVVMEVLPVGLKGWVPADPHLLKEATSSATLAGLREARHLWIKWSRLFVNGGVVELPMPGLPFRSTEVVTFYQRHFTPWRHPAFGAAVNRSEVMFGRQVGAGRRLSQQGTMHSRQPRGRGRAVSSSSDDTFEGAFSHLARCTRWLVDIGCGFGVASEILLRERAPAQWTFETIAYPKTGMEGRANVERDYRERFAHIPGVGDVGGLCIVGVEGNPWFRERLQQREKELRARGHPTVFLAPTALAGHDGDATFTVDVQNAAVNYWGSSLAVGGMSNPNTRSGVNVTVPTLVLSTLFQRIGIPESAEVILHMNAEGGEFVAIRQAVADGSLCRLVDHLTLDLHYKYFACRQENGIRGRRCVHGRMGGMNDTFSPAQLEQWLRAPGCRMKTLKIWGQKQIQL